MVLRRHALAGGKRKNGGNIYAEYGKGNHIGLRMGHFNIKSKNIGNDSGGDT
jgi:hypothetical protein